MQPRHDTRLENLHARTIELLNRHLTGAIDLHAQVKQASWSLRGPRFTAIHQRLDEVATAIAHYAYLIAEWAGRLGGTTPIIAQAAVDCCLVAPCSLDVGAAVEQIMTVSRALVAFGHSTREAVGQATIDGDASIAALFAEISEDIDQQVWWVDSHVAGSYESRLSHAAFTLTGARPPEPDLHDRIDVWVNEGGAGGEVNR